MGVSAGKVSVQDQVKAEEGLGVDLIEYAGHWVAVQDHQVVDHDESLRPLVDRLNGQRETVEIFKVRDKPSPAVL
jgi:hypothetical protein